MTDHIDEFESMFRRAERELFRYADIPLASIAMVTDQNLSESERRRDALFQFCPAIQGARCRLITGDQYSNVGTLLDLVNQEQTDLVVTWRHLHEHSFVPQHSLGVYLDVLTQATTVPVLVLPGTAASPSDITADVCDRTMAVADHISGDHRLINYAARMCPDGGQVWLCHVEDDAVFERYMSAIETIPQIDTEQARTLLEATLLKDAQDFIDACTTELQQARPRISCDSRVTRGHFLRQYAELIRSAQIDLLVVNTRDEDQLAMHGMAWSLTVELIDVAILLL